MDQHDHGLCKIVIMPLKAEAVDSCKLRRGIEELSAESAGRTWLRYRACRRHPSGAGLTCRTARMNGRVQYEFRKRFTDELDVALTKHRVKLLD
jgi:hypothetical protein